MHPRERITSIITRLLPQTYGISVAFSVTKFFHGGKHMFKAVSAAVLSIFLLASSALAAPRQGSRELLLSGGFFHQEGADEGNLNLDLSYGIFLTPGWQVGFRQAVNY